MVIFEIAISPLVFYISSKYASKIITSKFLIEIDQENEIMKLVLRYMIYLFTSVLIIYSLWFIYPIDYLVGDLAELFFYILIYSAVCAYFCFAIYFIGNRLIRIYREKRLEQKAIPEDPEKKIKRKRINLIAGIILGSLAIMFIGYFIIYLLSQLRVNESSKKANDVMKEFQQQAADQAYLASANDSIAANIRGMVVNSIEKHYQENGTYSGFIPSVKTSVNNDKCQSEMKIDISPDGKEYVIHQPVCGDPAKSFCYDNNSTEVKEKETEYVKKYYKCK